MPANGSLRSSSIPISAMFVTISAARDHEQAAGIKTVIKDFFLPTKPAGNEGGVFTSTTLQVFNEMHSDSNNDEMTWMQVIERLRDIILEKGYTNQVPQLSSSVLMNVHEPFAIVPNRATETKYRKRAILIGINYIDCKEEYLLTGCHNDVKNIKEYLISHQGFNEKDMVILMDDRNHAPPTRKNILKSLELLTQHSEAGDVVFFHYSGHGIQCPDDDGSDDEIDDMDEAIIPCDADTAGPILDDEIYYRFVLKMKEGVRVFTLMDACHSATNMDLPYIIQVGEKQMRRSAKIRPQDYTEEELGGDDDSTQLNMRGMPDMPVRGSFIWKKTRELLDCLFPHKA